MVGLIKATYSFDLQRRKQRNSEIIMHRDLIYIQTSISRVTDKSCAAWGFFWGGGGNFFRLPGGDKKIWPMSRGDQDKFHPLGGGTGIFFASHMLNIFLKNTFFACFSSSCVSNWIIMLRGGPRLIFKSRRGTRFNFQCPGGVNHVEF